MQCFRCGIFYVGIQNPFVSGYKYSIIFKTYLNWLVEYVTDSITL